MDMNIWLRSCTIEIIEPIKGAASGKLPEWLHGALFQNGGGLWDIGNTSYNHVFDCMGLLHKYEIKNREITYQCRFVPSETYKRNTTANKIVVSEFATSATSEGLFGRIISAFNELRHYTDNATISVYPFGNDLYCLSEYPYIHKINKNTLETSDRKDFRSMHVVQQSSHPQITKDGTVYSLVMTLTIFGIYHKIVCFPIETNSKDSNYMFKNARVVACIPARWRLNPSYMHSFGITDNYFIVIEHPLTVNVPKLVVNRLLNGPISTSLECLENELTKINILDRRTGELKYEFYADGLSYFHVINSYEYNSHIILDICSTNAKSFLDCLYKSSLKNAQNDSNFANKFGSLAVRYVLPLLDLHNNVNTKKINLVKLGNTTAKAYFDHNGRILVESETLCLLRCETPTINYDSHAGKKYRYFYATGMEVNSENSGIILKVDTLTKTYKSWREKDCYPNEPVFVPSPNAENEDDGVILITLLRSSNTKMVTLITLDAQTFTEISRTTFETPSPVPRIFHGCFLDS